MPKFVAKLGNVYFEWSTVVDAPMTYAMTRKEIADYLLFWNRGSGEEIEERLEKVDKYGTDLPSKESAEKALERNRAGANEKCLTLEKLYDLLIESRIHG
jgi:hypothetical protein